MNTVDKIRMHPRKFKKTNSSKISVISVSNHINSSSPHGVLSALFVVSLFLFLLSAILPIRRNRCKILLSQIALLCTIALKKLKSANSVSPSFLCVSVCVCHCEYEEIPYNLNRVCDSDIIYRMIIQSKRPV